MKKLLFISLIAFSLSAGCSKDKTEDPPYFLKFSVNGEQKNFTTYTIGSLLVSSLIIQGTDKQAPNENGVKIYIAENSPSGTPLSPGVYEEKTHNVLATYLINGIQYSAGPAVSEELGLNGIPNPWPLKVTITDITSTTISGTFSGDFYDFLQLPGGPKFQIREGQFKVQVK